MLPLLIEIHYRYYQFYANMLVAAAVAYALFRGAHGFGPYLVVLDVGFVMIEAVFFVTSRDNLRLLVDHISEIMWRTGLCGREFGIRDDFRMTSAIRHSLLGRMAVVSLASWLPLVQAVPAPVPASRRWRPHNRSPHSRTSRRSTLQRSDHVRPTRWRDRGCWPGIGMAHWPRNGAGTSPTAPTSRCRATRCVASPVTR